MTPALSVVEERFYRFDEFQVDPVRRLLLRDGETVPITPKALAILVVLLENQGKVVAKEELIRQVWGGGYVSDANLTQNISFARKALGERAGDRRYIVTVPGQGYCFAAPITVPTAVPAALAALDTEPRLAEAPEPPAAPPPDAGPASAELVAAPPPAVAVPRPWLRIAVGVAILILVLGVSAGLSQLTRGLLAPATDLGSPTFPRRTSIAVVGFKNLSEDSRTDWIGKALAEMLTTELAAGSKVRVVSRENVTRARGALSLPESGAPDGDTLEKIRLATGADMLVSGSYLALGEGSASRIRLDLRVTRTDGAGELIASLAEMGSEPELFEMVSRTGAKLRQKLAFDEPSPQQAQAARALQPAGADAVRLYTEGVDLLIGFEAPQALELLRQAAEADPGSAVIRSALARALADLGHDEEAAEEAKRAFELADGLPREARLLIEARLYELNKQWSKASEIYQSLCTFFPDNLEYGLQLGMSQMMAGSAAEAHETITSLRRLPVPDGMDPRIDLLESRIARRLSDLASQRRAAEAAVAKGWHSGQTLLVAQALIFQGDAILLEGDPAKAIKLFQRAQELARAEGHPYISAMALSNLGVALQARGDLDAAERAQRASLEAAERIGSRNGIAAQLQVLGLLYLARGDLAKALDSLERSQGLFAQLGDRMMETRSLNAIARVKFLQGEFAGAWDAADLALRTSRGLGSRREEAEALNLLGRIVTWQGKPAEGLRRHEEAYILYRQVGDLQQASSALADSAGLMSWLNDVASARRRYRQALLIKRRLGDRVGMVEILDRLAGLAYREGDIHRSRRLSEWELRMIEETGARNWLAKALTRLGRVQWAAAELVEARHSFERALALSTERGEEMEKLVIHLYMAGVAMAENRFDEAARLAGHAAAGYRAHGVDESEVQAVSLQAEALLRAGRPAEAREAAERARTLFPTIESAEIHTLVASRIACVDAVGGDADRAVRELRPHLARARASGYGNAYLRGRLTQGEILMATDTKAGKAALVEVRREAAERGFTELERKAVEVLETGGVFARWTGPRP